MRSGRRRLPVPSSTAKAALGDRIALQHACILIHRTDDHLAYSEARDHRPPSLAAGLGVAHGRMALWHRNGSCRVHVAKRQAARGRVWDDQAARTR